MAYILKITLEGTQNPIVWRKVKVNEHISFERLHYVIQSIFDWEQAHLYAFTYKTKGKKIFIEDPKSMEDEANMFLNNDFFKQLKEQLEDLGMVETKDNKDHLRSDKTFLSDILKRKNSKALYEYDFGDSCVHTIMVEAITDELLLVPICIDGEGQAPPEDCGGVWGYQDMLEILKDKDAEDYENTVEWLEDMGYELPLDPYKFDLDIINENLSDAARNGLV